MTKDTEALREALAAHYPTGEWMQPCGNHVLCCSCGENLWGVDRDACKAAWRTHVIEALATPASDELGFDPTAEVGDEVFPHDTIGNGGGPVSQPYPGADDLILAPDTNGGGLDPAAGEVGAVGEEASALRIGWWNDMRSRGVSQDNAIAKIRAAVAAHPPHPAPTDPDETDDEVAEFLVARVSQDTRVIGIDHPTEANWHEVRAAHVALRDRLNERLVQADLCPVKPVDPVAGGEALRVRDILQQILDMEPTEMVKSPSFVRSLVREALAALKGPAA